MQYQLSLWQTLAANFSSDNIIMSLILLGVRVVLPIVIFIQLRKHPKIRAIVLAIFIAITVGMNIYPIYGNGWKITDKQLHMNAYGMSDTINIADMQIGIVDVGGQWDPVRRNIGSGMPGLLTGRCTMDNGKKALVFYYQNQEQMLLIEAQQKYYVIAYPGMNGLYNELLKLGAREGEFK